MSRSFATPSSAMSRASSVFKIFSAWMHAGFAAGAEAVQMRPAGRARARAERERFENVRAAAHAAVENHFEAVTGCVDDLLEHIERRRREIELPPAVVADHDGASRRCPPRASRPRPS